MKILKVMLKKRRTEKETGFTYPAAWDKLKANVLAYEDSDTLGDVEEYCIALVHDDAHAAELLKDPAVVEIDEATADTLGDSCRPQRLTIDDHMLPEILLAIDKDKAERTKEEQDMLDPDSEVKGINRSKKFSVRSWIPE